MILLIFSMKLLEIGSLMSDITDGICSKWNCDSETFSDYKVPTGTTSALGEIPSILWNLKSAIQASEMPPVTEFNLEVTKNRTPQFNEEPKVPTPSWRLSVPIEATNLGGCGTVPVPDRPSKWLLKLWVGLVQDRKSVSIDYF